MESYRTEEEQLEAIKRWWQENGRGIVLGIVLALGVGFGWQAWQKSRQQAAEAASTLYQQMLVALSTEDGQGLASARALAERIRDEYRGSSYAQFAALHLARLAVTDGQLAEAEGQLRWVLAMADKGSDMEQIARLRLARVVAAAGDPAQALDMLAEPGASYAASYAIARGDILLAEGREGDALAEFEGAASAMDPDTPMPRTLREKLEYLAARVEAAGAG